MANRPYKFTTKKHKKVLPKDLRALPGEIVTTDIGDDTKVHEHDPRHIRGSIIKAAAKKEKEVLKTNILAESFLRTMLVGIAKKNRQRAVDQYTIDLCRGWHLAKMALHADPDFSLKHIWMERPSGWAFSVREGAPPPDRPKHLKPLQLEIDLTDWPPRIIDLLREAGIRFDLLLEDVNRAKAQADFWRAVENARGETNS